MSYLRCTGNVWCGHSAAAINDADPFADLVEFQGRIFSNSYTKSTLSNWCAGALKGTLPTWSDIDAYGKGIYSNGCYFLDHSWSGSDISGPLQPGAKFSGNGCGVTSEAFACSVYKDCQGSGCSKTEVFGACQPVAPDLALNNIVCKRDRSDFAFFDESGNDDWEHMMLPYALPKDDSEAACQKFDANRITSRNWPSALRTQIIAVYRALGYKDGSSVNDFHGYMRMRDASTIRYIYDSGALDSTAYTGDSLHLPYLCSRQKVAHTIEYRIVESETKTERCYRRRTCDVRIDLPFTVSRKVTRTNVPLSGTMSIQDGPVPTPITTTMSVSQGSSESSRFEFTAPDAVGTARVYFDVGEGKKVKRQAYADLQIEELETLQIVSPTAWPQVVFQGETWQGRFRRDRKKDLGETVCCSGVVSAYTIVWPADEKEADFTLAFRSDAPVDSATRIHWPITHRWFNETTPTYVFDVRPKGELTATQQSPVVVANQTANFTVALSHAAFYGYEVAVAVADPVACPVNITNSTGGATLFWEAGSFATAVLNVTPAATITSPTSCALTFTTVRSSPQFDAPSNVGFVVQPMLDVRVEGLPPTLSVSTGYTITLKTVVPGTTTGTFWFGVATLAAACDGSTVVADVSPNVTTAAPSRTFTLTTGPDAGSCNFTVKATGPSAPHINPVPNQTLTIGSIGQLAATVNSESVYVGQPVTLTIADATNKLKLVETATVQWTWNGNASGMIGMLQTAAVVLSVATRSVQINFTTAAAGTGNFSFVVSGQPTSVAGTLAQVPFTVLPLKEITVHNTLPANVSTGAKYGVAIVVSIPSLPLAGVVTVTPNFNSTLWSVTPASLTWASGDSVNVPKTLTFVALAPSYGVSTPTSVITSGNATEFAMGQTHSTGAAVTYTRVSLNTTTTLGSVYLVPGARLKVMYNLTETLPPHMTLVLYFYTLSVTSKYSMTLGVVIWPNQNGAELHITPLAVSPAGSPYVAPLLWYNHSSWYTSWLGYWLEPEVAPLRFEVLQALVVTVTCNSTTLYIGPGNALGCNVSVPHVPTTGTVVVAVTDEASFGFVFGPATFTFPAGGQPWTIITVQPPAAPGAFADLSTRTLRFALTDESFTFDTAVRPTVTVTLRQLKQLSLTLSPPMSTLLPSTPFNVTVSGAPVNLTVTAVAPLAGFSFAPMTVETNAASASRNISVTVTEPLTFTLTFGVQGDPTYAATTSALAVTMPIPPRLTLTSQVNGTGVTAPTTFVGQLRHVVVSTGGANAVPLGRTLVVALAYNCSGVAAPGAVSWAASTVTIGSNETTASTNFTALSTCAAGSVIVTAVTGTARYHYLPPLARAINILAAKTVSVSWGSSRVYAGGVNQTTLRIVVQGQPLQPAPQSVVLTLSNGNHAAIAGMGPTTTQAFSQGSPLDVTTNMLAAPDVWSVTRVTSTLALSGVAASEYALVAPSVFIDVYPVTNVSVNNALATTPTLYIGETVTVRVSLPESPLNAGGTVVVSPSFDGAPSAVELAPASATLSATKMFQDFTVKALDTTTGSEFVTFTFPSGGTAHQYYPQAAAKQWPVTFKALGKVTIGTVPREVFEGLTSTIEITITEIPPTGYSNVVVTATSSDTSKLTVSGSATWTAGSSEPLTKTITIVGGTPTPSVLLNFALSAPAIVEPTLNTVSADLTVKDARSVIITLPSYVYVTKSSPGSVQLVKLPGAGMRLDLDYTLSTASRTLEILPRPMSFTPSSAKTMEIAVAGLVVAPSVTIAFSRSNDGDAYDTPPPHTMEVRALETVTATGIPAAMYVGTQATVTVTISRLPQCAGSYLTVKPVFGTSDGTFTPANKTWLSTDSGALSTSFLLSALTETVAAIPITFELTGDCMNIYEASARQTVSGTHVLPKETIAFRLPANMTDGDGGFTYEANNVTLTVDLGAPRLPHAGVSVAIGFGGTPGTVAFNETTVHFPAGVHVKNVSVRGAATTAAFPLTASVTVGASAFSVPSTMPVLRVLPRIPVRLNFDPSGYLLIANTSRELQFEVTATSALVGQMTASLVFGPELNVTNAITVAPKTPALSKYFTVIGLAESAAQPLRVVLSGPAAGFYTVLNDTFIVPVVRQRWVEVSASPSFVYVGPLNTRLVTLRLASLPTLPGDNVYVSLTNSPSLRFNTSFVQLTAAQPSATVSVEGVQSGATGLSSFISVTSQSVEYARTVLFATGGGAAATVDVRNRLKVTLGGYVGTIYADRSISFNVTIPLPALTGSLGITPVLAQPGYNLVATPAVLWFNGSTGPLTKSFTLTAPSTVLARTALRFNSQGSPEYETQVADETVEVILQNQLGFAGWSASLYPGAPNKNTFTVSVSRLPDPGQTLTITPTSSANATTTKLTFEPTNVTFTNVSALAQQISVIGKPIPYGSVAETVSFVQNDTMAFYEQLATRDVSVRAYENATTSIDRAVIYKLETLTVTIDLSVAPTEDMTITMAVRKNSTGASQTMVPVPSTEAFVAATSKYVTGQTRTTFTVRAETAPLTALVSFTLSGPGAARYQTTFLKDYLVRFVPLRTITAVVPPTMYLGLRNTMSLTVERAPEDGDGVIVVTALLDAALNITSTIFRWDAPTQPRTITLDLYPVAIGSANVRFTIDSLARGFQSAIQPSTSFSVLVREPGRISLVGMPASTFIGVANTITLSAKLSEPLQTDEQLLVALTANTSMSISPTADVDLSLGSAIWTVYRDGAPAFARFTVSFTATVNRWVLDPTLANGVSTYFRPLKKITVKPPSKSSYIVGEEFTFELTLPEAPQPGASLLANLQYGGSPTNVKLPDVPAQWTSDTTSLVRTIKASGNSPTTPEAITVVFSNDPSYDLTPYVFYVKFDPLFIMETSLAAAVFVNRKTTLTVFNPEQRVVDVTPSVSPSGAVTFSPATLSFVLGADGKAQAQGTIEVTAVAISRATISFALSGGDASKYNDMQPEQLNVIGETAIRVDVPSQNMRAYLGTSGVDVTVELPRAPQSVPVNVTPTWSLTCNNGFADFSVTPLQFRPGGPTKIKFTIRPIRANSPCALQFPVTTSPDGFVSPSSLYTVEARPLHNVSLTGVPTRLFPGDANRVPLEVSLDSDTPLPLDKPVNVSFTSLDPSCIVVSPPSLLWAAGNAREPRSKVIFVSETPMGTCIKDGQRVGIAGSAESKILQLNLPPVVTMDVKPLLKITAKEPAFSSTDYYVFKGDSSLSFSVTLEERLLDGEQLTVKAVYVGNEARITANDAVWKGSASALTQYIVLEGKEIAPHAKLEFRVTGPPRYEALARGGGFLEVFGPLSVTAEVPKVMLAGLTYNFKVTVQDRPFPGETLLIRPVWEGRNQSLSFTPGELTWQSNTLTLQQTMTITTHEVSGAYMLDMKVSGSTRFVSTAFRDTVEIKSPQVITTRGVPIQMMVGESYSMTVDVGVLPASVFDTLRILIAAQRHNSLDCLSLSTSELEFSSADPLAPTTQIVTLRAIRACPLRDVRFAVTGNASLAYNRTVVPRPFTTVPPAAVAVAWPIDSYIGADNSPEAFVTLQQRPASGYGLNVTVNATCGASNNSAGGSFDVVSYPSLLQWSSSDLPEKTVSLVGLQASSCSFTFTATTNDPTYPATSIPTATTIFYPLLSITRTPFPATIYAGQGNQAEMTVSLSSHVRQPGGEPTRVVRLRPSSPDTRIVFQPPVLEWHPGASPDARLFVWARSVVAEANITFAVEGDGASFVASTPPPVTFGVTPLLQIAYTNPPAELFVTMANAAYVNLTAPNGTVLNVTGIVDGDRNAINLSPATLVWTATSPRTQQIKLTGLYGTEVRCRLRYAVSGPPFVEMAAGSALQQIHVRALQTVTRTPDGIRLSAPEQTVQELHWTPTSVGVQCTTTVNTTFFVRNTTNNITYIHRTSAGLVGASCEVDDPTFATPAPFELEATPKKRITIPSIVNAFVGIDTVMSIVLSAKPSSQDNQVQLGFENQPAFFRFSPNNIRFEPTSPTTLDVIVRGVNATAAPVDVIPSVPGGQLPDEYRRPEFLGTRVMVRERVRLAVQVSFTATRVTRDGPKGELVAYTGAKNGVQLRMTLSAPTLTGPVRVQPLYDTEDRDGTGNKKKVYFSKQSVLFFTNTEILTASLDVITQGPVDFAKISLYAEGPAEFVGGTTDVANVSFVDLEHVTILQDTLPPVVYVGVRNAVQLGVRVSGYPGPDKVVEIEALPSSSALTITPKFVTFDSEMDVANAPLVKYFTVTGMSAEEGTKINLAMMARSRAASNFKTQLFRADYQNETSSAPATLRDSASVVTSVRPLMGFDVLDPVTKAPKRQVEFFNSEGEGDNRIVCEVALDGLPVSKTPATVEVVASDPSLVSISPSVLQFSRGQGSRTANVVVFGLNATQENVTLLFALSGPPEYAAGRRITVKLGILAKLAFEAKDVPPFVAVGVENTKTFAIRPARSGLVISAARDTAGGAPCKGIAFAATDALDWSDQTWKRVSVSAEVPSEDESAGCEIYVEKKTDAPDASKFVQRPFATVVRAYAAPTVTAVAGATVEVPVSRVKAGFDFAITLNGAEVYEFRQTQKFDVAAENATILVSSSTATATSFAARMAVNKNLIRVQSLTKQGRLLTLRIGGDSAYTTPKRETVTLEVLSGALKNDVHARQRKVTLTVLGEKDELVSDTAASVISNGAGAAAVAGGAMSLGAATSAGKLETIMKAYNCPNPDWKYEQEDMGWTDMPIPMRFGSVEDLGVYAAVGVSNTVLIGIFVGVHLGVAGIVWQWIQRRPVHSKTYATARAMVRYPSLTLFPVLILYQGIVSSSLLATLYSPIAGLRMVGATTLIIVGVGVPLFMWTRVGPGFLGIYEKNVIPEEKRAKMGFFRKLVTLDGTWDNPEHHYWVLRYGMFFDEMRGGYQWWLFVDACIVFMLGIVDGVVPTTMFQCRMRNYVNCGIFAVQLIMIVVCRPYRMPIGNIFFVVAYVLQLVAMVLITIAHSNQTPTWGGVEVSTQCLFFFTGFLMVKSIMDAVIAFNEFTGVERILSAQEKHTFEEVKDAEADEDQVADMSRGLRETFHEDVALERARLTGVSEATALGAAAGAGAGGALGMSSKRAEMERLAREEQRRHRVLNDGSSNDSGGGLLSVPMAGQPPRREPVMKKRVNPQVEALLGRNRRPLYDDEFDDL